MPTANQDETLLLHLNEAIATIRDKDQLFQTMARKLRLIFSFEMMGINVFDKELLHKRLFFKDYTTLPPPEPSAPNTTLFTPIAGSPVEQLLVDPRIQHIELRHYVQHYADFEPFQRLRRQGIQYLTMAPLWLNGRLTGYLILATTRLPAYTPEDEALLEKIASLVAVAVNNSLEFEEVARREQERTLQLNITNALLSIKQREPLFRAIAEELAQVVPFDYFGLRVQRAGAGRQYEGFAEFARPDHDPRTPLLALAPNRFVNRESEIAGYYNQIADLLNHPGLYAGDEYRALAVRYPAMRYAYDEHHVRAMLVVPIWQRADGAAVLTLAASTPTGFGPTDLATVQALVPQVALALENLFAFEQIEELKAQVEQERTYLIDEINTDRVTLTVGINSTESLLYKRLVNPALPRPADLVLDRLTFANSRATLGAEGAQQLGSVASLLKTFPKARVLVLGHANIAEDEATKLGLKRATAAVEELRKQGIDPSRVQAQGALATGIPTDNDPAERVAMLQGISLKISRL